jgi:hypothetical protein
MGGGWGGGAAAAGAVGVGVGGGWAALAGADGAGDHPWSDLRCPPVYRPVFVVQPARAYTTSSYATYSAPVLYRAQTRLARLGYYRGPIDGDFGPMTNRAIRNYQADYGLPITGRLDSRTRASLGV